MFLFVMSQILLLHSISLHAALRDHSTFNESNLTNELTVHLVQKCFLYDDYTVAVIGAVPEVVVKMLHRSEITATTSVGDSRLRSDGMYGEVFYSKVLYRKPFWIKMQRVVHAFVIAASTQPLLRLALEKARTSVWWNSSGFFVVTSTSENDDCGNAFTYLWTLWQMGILYSVFLCKENDGSLAMYGYSPYYDGHSTSWRKVQVHGGRGGHPWNLLKLKQVYDVNICEIITFDKVNRLDGHPIVVGILLIPPTMLMDTSGGDWFSKHIGEDAMIIHIIWKALNGSIQPIYYEGKNPIGFANENQSYTGFMADVSMGRVDHGANGLWADLYWGIRAAYPHAASGVHLLTASKGNIPNWMKFITMYKLSVIIGIQITLLIATIFFRYVDHRPWPVAILEVIRVMLSVTMLRLPRRLPTRLFGALVFVMIVVMTSTFQGLLISIITKPTSYQNIDTFDDIVASGYSIYGYTVFRPFFDESELSKRFYAITDPTPYYECIQRGDPIAFASDYMHLKARTMSTEHGHMSQQAIGNFYTGYFTKLDWPLFNRFDTIIQRLFNAGITKYWREFYLNKIAREHWAEMRNASRPHLKVLTVPDLAFVFNILIIGLLCSSIAFVIELIMHRVRH